jgi:hypothetical protein
VVTGDGDIGLIVHGSARELELGSAEEVAYTTFVVDCYAAQHGDWWRDWFEARRREAPPDADPGFTGWIEPRRIYAKG